jgi:hypothetical protein
MFENPRVQGVKVTVLGEWTDKYGKRSTEPSTASLLLRPTVDSRIGWPGLADLVEGDNKAVFCISDDFYVQPAIIKNLKNSGCVAASNSSP